MIALIMRFIMPIIIGISGVLVLTIIFIAVLLLMEKSK